MSFRFIKLAILLLSLIPIVSTADSKRSCKYDNFNFLSPGKSDDGEPIKEYKVARHPKAFSSWKYNKMLLCQRPDSSQYVIITDSFEVANPPQEVVEVTQGPSLWEKMKVNRARAGDKSSLNTLTLVRWTGALNGNTESIWVFVTNDHMIGGMPLLDGYLKLDWQK